MIEDFYSFVVKPDKEAFLASRDSVVNYPDYNAYSDDLDVINNLLDEGKFDEVISYKSININLSPRAQLYKSFACSQKGMVNEEKTFTIIGQMIQANIKLTGDGTLQKPYIITRIDDERDFLISIEEVFVSQALVKQDDKFLDCIETASGKKIYFDITDCYTKIPQSQLDLLFKSILKEEKPYKKWWKFW